MSEQLAWFAEHILPPTLSINATHLEAAQDRSFLVALAWWAASIARHEG
jgi:hypothetical protein